MPRRKSKVHRPNGPYLPVGLLGGEYCVKCRTAWPCADAPRCQAVTLAGKPEHLLVRCRLEEGHPRDHLPDWSEQLTGPEPTHE